MFRELAKLEPDSPEFRRHRDRIVERCLPLADHIARRFDGRGEARDDLVQVARVGLVNAVIRYDVDTGSDFVSFAVPTIMGEVRRHFRDNSWSVKVPRRLKELHLRLGVATSELSQKLGRAPTASELAAELDMDREEVVEGLVAGSSYNTLSIDSGGNGDEDAPAIVDTLGDLDLSLDQIENREALRPLLAALPERERMVIDAYLAGLKDEAYRDHVFAYVAKEDTPRPLLYQIDLLRSVGFSKVEILHKNGCFAAFGAIK